MVWLEYTKDFNIFFFFMKKKETAATMYGERKTQEEHFTYIEEINHVAKHSFRPYSVQIPRTMNSHHTSNTSYCSQIVQLVL